MRPDQSLAAELNRQLASLNVKTVSGDPFEWKSNADQQKLFGEVTDKLQKFVYASRTKVVGKTFALGVAAPLIILAIVYFLHYPQDESVRLWSECILGVVIIAGGLLTRSVIKDPSIDEDLYFAAFTVPKGWSFSTINQKSAWKAIRNSFGYFDKGDENQKIRTRIWGWLDNAREHPFQLLSFHYDTVTYQPVPIGKTVMLQRVVMPHERTGMFCAMAESKVRFRITETEGNDGLDSQMNLEFAQLNKAVNVYYDSKDELAVKKFLSPAVEEIVMGLSDKIDGMSIDFFHGFILVMSKEEIFDDINGIHLDGNAPRFIDRLPEMFGNVENFRFLIADGIAKICKYQ